MVPPRRGPLARVLMIVALSGCAAQHAPSSTIDQRGVPRAHLAPRNAPRDIGSLLEPIIARAGVPGMAAIVLQGDRIVAQGVAGVRKSGSDVRITIADKFLLCSSTKAMTATLAAMLVDEGRIGWTTTIDDVFGQRGMRVHPDWKPVTLAQLLQHRAGAASDGDNLWTSLQIELSSSTDRQKSRAIVARTLARPPQYPPGTRYVYSGIGYIVVGAMLEAINGQPWEALIRDRLWTPLGITSGGVGPPGTPRRIDQPWGHWGATFAGRSIAPGGAVARLSAPQFYAPAGTAHMTITDWARFVSLHLRGDPDNPNHVSRLLATESFATLHRAGDGKFYESGWILSTQPWARGPRARDSGRVLTSEGDNGFWHSDAWLAPETDFAVLVIINQGAIDGNKPAAHAVREARDELVRTFAPAPPPAGKD